MDTYIKMCDCPEIQDKEPHCEYYLNLYAYKKYSKVKNIGPMEYGDHAYIGRPIWLPRQDHLQEIVFNGRADDCHDPFCLLIDFYRFARGADYRVSNSFEQLWLAFVMWELHQKKWDGEKWI